VISITLQGQVFQVKDLTRKPSPPTEPPKRGEVTGFSAASRRRLIDLLARMDDSYKRCTFVTLTFQSLPSPAEAKQALKRFLMRVTRYFPEASGVWRMEFQERGAIHFHIIFFNLPYWPQFHLQDTWTICTDEVCSIVHIKLIRSFKIYMGYISKYVAKLPVSEANPSLDNASYQHNPPHTSMGRVWGYHNKSELPFAEIVILETADEELGHYAMWAIKALSRGHSGDSTYSQKLYTQQGKEILQFAAVHAAGLQIETVLAINRYGETRQWYGGLAVSPPTSVPLAG